MRTVFHCSSGRVDDWRHALANVESLLDDDTVGLDGVTLLLNGDAVYLATESSPGASRLSDLLDREVRVRVCRNSLDSRPAAADQLVSGVETVPSGVGELTKRQAAGDAYLKVP